jgi:5-methylthioadenosine/S-adenosylhomocysteine deaminase
VSLLLVQGGELLGGDGMLAAADVLVDGNLIVQLGPGLPAPEDARRLDASGRIVIPGLVNAHTHGHNNLSRGLAGRWTLEQMLAFGPALQAGRTPDDHFVSAALGAVEMVRTGCTAAYDLFMALPGPTEEVIEAVVAAYEQVGLRAVIAPSVADGPFYRLVPGLLDAVPDDQRRRLERLSALPSARLLASAAAAIERWHGHAGGRVSIAVSPSIPGQCSDEFLAGCAHLAREHGVGLHTHVAETRVQAVQARQRWGEPIVARLAALDALSPRFTAAHGVWLSPEEIRRLSDTGASVVHNPASNLRLGSGVAPVRDLLDAGCCVALGTDGSLSSDNQDMFESMRFAALVSRAEPGVDPGRWLDAREVWALATDGGARSLGAAGDIGRIEPGRRADLVLLRADSPFLRPANDPLNALVLAENGAAVDTVLVDGRIVLDRGRITGLDETALRDRAQAAVERLARDNHEHLADAARLAPYVLSRCRALTG